MRTIQKVTKGGETELSHDVCEVAQLSLDSGVEAGEPVSIKLIDFSDNRADVLPAKSYIISAIAESHRVLKVVLRTRLGRGVNRY